MNRHKNKLGYDDYDDCYESVNPRTQHSVDKNDINNNNNDDEADYSYSNGNNIGVRDEINEKKQEQHQQEQNSDSAEEQEQEDQELNIERLREGLFGIEDLIGLSTKHQEEQNDKQQEKEAEALEEQKEQEIKKKEEGGEENEDSSILLLSPNLFPQDKAQQNHHQDSPPMPSSSSLSSSSSSSSSSLPSSGQTSPLDSPTTAVINTCADPVAAESLAFQEQKQKQEQEEQEQHPRKESNDDESLNQLFSSLCSSSSSSSQSSSESSPSCVEVEEKKEKEDESKNDNIDNELDETSETKKPSEKLSAAASSTTPEEQLVNTSNMNMETSTKNTAVSPKNTNFTTNKSTATKKWEVKIPPRIVNSQNSGTNVNAANTNNYNNVNNKIGTKTYLTPSSTSNNPDYLSAIKKMNRNSKINKSSSSALKEELSLLKSNNNESFSPDLENLNNTTGNRKTSIENLPSPFPPCRSFNAASQTSFVSNSSISTSTSTINKITTMDNFKLKANDDQLKDFKEIVMKKLDINGNGYLELSELRDALKLVGIDIPGYEARKLEDKFKSNDQDKNGKLSLQEFESLYTQIKNEREERKFKSAVKPVKDATKIQKDPNDAIVHTVRHSEQLAFSKWINQNLAKDKDLKLSADPIDSETNDLYSRCKDGYMLCKLINLSVPGTIDERTLNTVDNKSSPQLIYKELENLELAIRSAEAIGCLVINIRPSDIHKGKEHLILGLLWQIIKIGLFSDIDLAHHPGLVLLLRDGETKEDLLKLTKEELLLRWMNYHLQRDSAYAGREVKNFSGDIKDSIAYTHLLKQIAPSGLDPQPTLGPLNEPTEHGRAEQMLREADKLQAREFVTPQDVCTGNQKLNTAFVANLFNTYPALDLEAEEIEIEQEDDLVKETREEKTYRNWMNSMGVEPYVNYLYTDLCDCLVIFQLYDMIKKGCVEWNRVSKKFNKLKAKFQKLDNCNYAIQLGKSPMNFKLVGIQGSNLLDGDKMFTLALVWQLMRAYTLSMLDEITGQGHPIVEQGIIEWTNSKLKAAGKKSSITSFQDPVISDSRVICDLIDSIKSNSIRYDILKSDNKIESKMDNARYAVSMARKIGARVFALPEDIVEVKQKMVMTMFATLMIKDYQPPQVSVVE